MSDFDRTLSRCIGVTASRCDGIDRTTISTCYYEALNSLGKAELPQVSEKWIDFLTQQLGSVKVAGRNQEQIADEVFRRIAKA